jgi:hypothetical protein
MCDVILNLSCSLLRCAAANKQYILVQYREGCDGLQLPYIEVTYPSQGEPGDRHFFISCFVFRVYAVCFCQVKENIVLNVSKLHGIVVVTYLNFQDCVCPTLYMNLT